MPGPATFVEIQILTGSRRNKELSFFDPELLRFGRQPGSEVLFESEDLVVSKRHAELRRQGPQGGDHFVLADVGSKFGTFLLARDESGRRSSQPSQPAGRVTTLGIPMPPGTSAAIQLGQGGPVCRLMAGRAIPFGRYLLVGKIGQGGMGDVYLAWEAGLDRFVVLKLIRPSTFQVAPDAENMLRDEARIVARMDSPHVVNIYEVNKEQGVLYIAMEYVRGVTLLDLAGQLHQLRRRMPPDLAAALVRQACLGLHAAHELVNAMGQPLHVVHRDVSPNNVLCTLEGLIKVIDFGVARARDRLSQGAPASGRGQKSEKIVGKPSYMSPEHILSPESVDRRSDVFSAGVILYELCTGEKLFNRDTVEGTLEAVCNFPVPPLRSACPEASEGLVQAVHRALQRQPGDRQQSALEFARELQQADPRGAAGFLHPENIAAHLLEVNVLLLPRLPVPLLWAPEGLDQGDKTTPHGYPAPALGPAIGQGIGAADAPVIGQEIGAGPEDTAVLALPLGREVHQQRLGAHGVLEVRALELTPLDSREPARLPLPLPALAPGGPPPLLVLLLGPTLKIRTAPRGHAGEAPERRPEQRIDLYRGEPGSDTHCQTFDIPSAATGQSFYAGYHRDRVYQIFYSSAAGPPGGGPLSLGVPGLGLRVSAPAGTQRLVTMHTADPESGVLHMACITLRSHSSR